MKKIFLFPVLTLIFSACKPQEGQKDEKDFLGKRDYRYPEWTSIQRDTIPDYAQELRWLYFNENNNEVSDTLFSYEGHEKVLYLYKKAVGTKQAPSKVSIDDFSSWGDKGEIGKYNVFDSRGKLWLVYGREMTELIQNKRLNFEIARNLNKDSVVFLGQSPADGKVGVFKERTETILQGQPLNPVLLYDLHAENYPDLTPDNANASFGVAFVFKDGEELLYTFDKWDRLLYINGRQGRLIKTIDTCELHFDKANAFGMTVFTDRPCDYTLVSSLIVGDYILAFLGKTATEDGQLFFDVYDKAKGEYLFSMPYGAQLQKGMRAYLKLATTRAGSDRVYAVYALLPKSVLVEHSFSKAELLAHIEAFRAKK